MAQSQQLIDTLKRKLKAAGLSYAKVGLAVDLSEASVKRLFSSGRFTLDRMEQICGLLGLELSDLARDADAAQQAIHRLNEAQEAELVRDHRLLLVAVCVLNQWSYERIVDTYRLEPAECVSLLIKLDKLGLIDLLPDNRVRLKVARDFAWLPNGPIRRFFHDHAQADFLDGRFDQDGEALFFVNAMLSTGSQARLQQKLRRLAQEMAELHAEETNLPANTREGVSMLLALRSWEPPVFSSMRRQPTTN